MAGAAEFGGQQAVDPASGCGPPGIRGVVVLGMGRSGTSSVTRMFERSCYFVGQPADLMPATESNPTGHFENLKVWRANEHVLARLDGTWFDPPPIASQLSWARELRPILCLLLDDLLVEAGARPLALKDPRIGGLMPLWWPLLKDVFHPVLVVRDPLEIGLSLEHRDMTAIPVTLAIWEINLKRTLAALDRRLVTVVRYCDVLRQPQVAARLVEDVSVRLHNDLGSAVRPELAPSALDPALRRNRSAGVQIQNWLNRHQLPLWRWLDSLPSGTSVLRVPACATILGGEAGRLTRYERQRQQTHFGMAASVNRAAEEAARRDRLIAGQQRLLREQQQHLERSVEHTAALEAERDDERARRVEAEHQLSAAEYWLAVLKASISWRMTAPLRGLAATARRARSASAAALAAAHRRAPSHTPLASGAWWFAITLSGLIALADVVTGRNVHLMGLLALVPCCTVLTQRWSWTARAGLLALLLGVPLGATESTWDTRKYFAMLGLVAAAALLSTFAAAVIEHHSPKGRQRRP